MTMDAGKHKTRSADSWRHLLPSGGVDSYPQLVPSDRTDLHRIRVDKEMWKAYAEIVGNGGRAADIREYIAWRIEHPETPLPGRWRGPVRRTRGTEAETQS